VNYAKYLPICYHLAVEETTDHLNSRILPRARPLRGQLGSKGTRQGDVRRRETDQRESIEKVGRISFNPKFRSNSARERPRLPSPPPGFSSSPFWESRDGTNEIPALIRSSWKRAAGDDEGSDRPANRAFRIALVDPRYRQRSAEVAAGVTTTFVRAIPPTRVRSLSPGSEAGEPREGEADGRANGIEKCPRAPLAVREKRARGHACVRAHVRGPRHACV